MIKYCMYYTHKIFYCETQQCTIIQSLDLALVPLSGAMLYNCQHWTKSVYDCKKTYYPNFDCSTNNIAGVTCTEGKQILIIITPCACKYKGVERD